jgi:hypothetical protein
MSMSLQQLAQQLQEINNLLAGHWENYPVKEMEEGKALSAEIAASMSCDVVENRKKGINKAEELTTKTRNLRSLFDLAVQGTMNEYSLKLKQNETNTDEQKELKTLAQFYRKWPVGNFSDVSEFLSAWDETQNSIARNINTLFVSAALVTAAQQTVVEKKSEVIVNQLR